MWRIARLVSPHLFIIDGGHSLSSQSAASGTKKGGLCRPLARIVYGRESSAEASFCLFRQRPDGQYEIGSP